MGFNLYNFRRIRFKSSLNLQFSCLGKEQDRSIFNWKFFKLLIAPPQTWLSIQVYFVYLQSAASQLLLLADRPLWWSYWPGDPGRCTSRPPSRWRSWPGIRTTQRSWSTLCSWPVLWGSEGISLKGHVWEGSSQRPLEPLHTSSEQSKFSLLKGVPIHKL